MKSIIFEIKNILNRNHDKLDPVAEKTEDIVIKIIQRNPMANQTRTVRVSQ